jgi:hypothetical protein
MSPVLPLFSLKMPIYRILSIIKVDIDAVLYELKSLINSSGVYPNVINLVINAGKLCAKLSCVPNPLFSQNFIFHIKYKIHHNLNPSQSIICIFFIIGNNNITFTPRNAFGICLFVIISSTIASNIFNIIAVSPHFKSLNRGKNNKPANLTCVNVSPPPSKNVCPSVVFITIYIADKIKIKKYFDYIMTNQKSLDYKNTAT